MALTESSILRTMRYPASSRKSEHPTPCDVLIVAYTLPKLLLNGDSFSFFLVGTGLVVHVHRTPDGMAINQASTARTGTCFISKFFYRQSIRDEKETDYGSRDAWSLSRASAPSVRPHTLCLELGRSPQKVSRVGWWLSRCGCSRGE